MPFCRLLVVATAVALTACASTTAPAPLPESQLLGQPISINKPGALRHEPSGFEFAEAYGSFRRVSARRYDTAGLNVGIGYDDRRSDCTIVTTFFVYPTPDEEPAPDPAPARTEQGWLDAEFSVARRYVRYKNPGMLLPELGLASTPTSKGLLPGLQLGYRDASKFSELRLFVYGKRWFLKYRFSYPESCESEASQRIAALVADMPWNHTGS
jgi:hypothetical protein